MKFKNIPKKKKSFGELRTKGAKEVVVFEKKTSKERESVKKQAKSTPLKLVQGKRLVVNKNDKNQKPAEARFPKNSRIIPEDHPAKRVVRHITHHARHLRGAGTWLQIWNVAAIVLLFVLGFAIQKEVGVLGEKEKQRAAVVSQIQYWQAIAQDKPNYRDAYLQIARFSYSLGDKTRAQEALQKALSIDPNNEFAIKLQQEMK